MERAELVTALGRRVIGQSAAPRNDLDADERRYIIASEEPGGMLGPQGH